MQSDVGVKMSEGLAVQSPAGKGKLQVGDRKKGSVRGRGEVREVWRKGCEGDLALVEVHSRPSLCAQREWRGKAVERSCSGKKTGQGWQGSENTKGVEESCSCSGGLLQSNPRI